MSLDQTIQALAKNAVATADFSAVRKAPAFDPSIVAQEIAQQQKVFTAAIAQIAGNEGSFMGKSDHLITFGKLDEKVNKVIMAMAGGAEPETAAKQETSLNQFKGKKAGVQI
jgi:hypothetical protein